MTLRLLIAPSLFLIASCGTDIAPATEKSAGPEGVAALADDIIVDPDLVGQNNANALATVQGRGNGVPALDTSADAVTRARQQALAMVGGASALRTAPVAEKAVDGSGSAATLKAAALAAAAPGGRGDCASAASYTMAWAAKLPSAFPVYPQGAVQEAAGTDTAGCSLRVVSFQTPVSVQDVMDFYFTRATVEGFSARRTMQDGDDTLAGTKGAASFIIYARRLPNGATEADLITSGS